MSDIPKAYESKGVEQKLYDVWDSSGYFKPSGEGPVYSITIPPPNVTGSLHIGHALCYSLQDLLIRWKRMQGFRTLCVPGTDHAGIATQNVVEKVIRSEGLTRFDLGREKFEQRVWDWVNEYGGVILTQLRRLGCSYDWSRTRFTRDQAYVDAIYELFSAWWEAGHIYRGRRVINWCTRCTTALSDIEVEHEDRDAKLYHLRYPFRDRDGHVVVATTRPETMLGDTAVAANPADDRYSRLFGETLVLPLVGREIKLIADDYARPEFGSGAVKVTPAHDANDFEAGMRNNLDQVVVIDESGRMSPQAGPRYAGLDRFEAREKVLADLEAAGAIERIEDYVVPTAICARCKTVIEPLLSEQWFVRMKEIARPAIEAVRDGRIKFVPERYEKTYLDWMENIRDWCISRQLWWGHRIPAWSTGDGEYVMALSAEEALAKSGGKPVVQDEDVLDTWFSSALWPHAVLGWPEDTEDLRTYYPTSVLVTSREIIYLWVARMIMTGLYFKKEIPFHEVYIYATVLNEQGKRMSKSLGTGVDPMEMIELYGADALRFALFIRTARGQDIKFAAINDGRQRQVEEARNFANKIWNASRFVLMNLSAGPDRIESRWVESDELHDRWILSRLNSTIDQVSRALDEYKINEAAQHLYHFFWDDFCDWYIELSKPLVASRETNGEVAAARSRIAYVLEISLRLLHPFMPFITEEIWRKLPHEGESIMLSPFPVYDPGLEDREAGALMEDLISVITKVRNIRSEVSVPAQTRLKLVVVTPDRARRKLIEENARHIQRLALVEEIRFQDQIEEIRSAARDSVAGLELVVPLEGVIDLAKERERLRRELAKKETEARGLATRLDNDSFQERAPADVVRQTMERHGELVAEIEKVRKSLQALG